jgi:hypothetical protein
MFLLYVELLIFELHKAIARLDWRWRYFYLVTDDRLNF